MISCTLTGEPAGVGSVLDPGGIAGAGAGAGAGEPEAEYSGVYAGAGL